LQQRCVAAAAAVEMLMITAAVDTAAVILTVAVVTEAAVEMLMIRAAVYIYCSSDTNSQ
jgi:hypothetical protein